MDTNEKACLVEGVLDGLDNYSELTNRVAAAAIVAAIEAVEAEEKDPEEYASELHDVIEQRDKYCAILAGLRKELDRMRDELSEAKDRSKGHLTEARDQAVAELAKVQAELDDLRQNGGRDRIDKLVKARMADERREIAEMEARCMEDAKRLVSERDAMSKHCEELGLRLAKEMKRSDETMQALVARSKERDDARWECAQLHKELALYRPKPEQTEEAKP